MPQVVLHLRVVLDTNILISAAWKPSGLEAQTLAHALAGRFTLLASSATWAEYQEVLSRPKFASKPNLLPSLYPLLTFVESTERLTLATDEDDNRFLELALAGRADFLVTGNLKHYPPSLGPTRILNARQFLNAASLSFSETS